MTTTPTSGAADLPEALRSIQRFEVVDCIDDKHVPAVIPEPHGPWVRYEDHIAALAAGQATAAPATTPQAAQQASAGVTLRSMIEGMSVSVDVSTGDHDAGHRYFGTVTEVMECQGDKHGVALLVQDAEPNFTATPTAPSTPSTTAQSADSVPSVSDLPPLPAPDLRDVGTKPQEIKEFLKGYATEYARTAIAARAPADSVTAPAPPPECETEAEKRAFAFGWFKALESERRKADSVQEEAARLDFLIEQRAYVVSDPDDRPGYWLHWARPDGSTWVQIGEYPTPRAAIDEARRQEANHDQ